MKLLVLFLGLAAEALADAQSESHHPRSSMSSAYYKPGYRSTFFEPFLGTPGSLPLSSNWIFALGTQYPGGAPQWGNNEFESYTTSPANIHLTDDGTLAIIPRLDAAGSWTSARIETQRADFLAAAGGKLYVEARLKVGDAPEWRQQGIWAGFWAMGSAFRGNYMNWPAATEWDFMEAINGRPLLYSTIHCGRTAPGGPCNEYVGLGSAVCMSRRGIGTRPALLWIGVCVGKAGRGRGRMRR